MRGLSLLLAVLLAGCVSAKTFPSGPGRTYEPTHRNAVLVFFSADDIERPYETVAEIMTEGSSGWGQSDADLVRKAQKEAAKVGAHAIVITKEKGAGALTAAIFGSADKVQRVQAIRFTDVPRKIRGN